MIKQGFNNFMYTVADSRGKVGWEKCNRRQFYLTENDYTVLVYYRENNERYDRVIGIGHANSENITN